MLYTNFTKVGDVRLMIWAPGQERQAASAGTYAEIDNARPFVSKCHKVRLLY